jgi:hypothetical protein
LLSPTLPELGGWPQANKRRRSRTVARRPTGAAGDQEAGAGPLAQQLLMAGAE